jgi:hypothetical protein
MSHGTLEEILGARAVGHTYNIAQHDCLDGVFDMRTSLSAHICKDVFEKEKANSIKFIATYLLQDSNPLVQSTTI